MLDVRQVLAKKERDLERVRREIRALVRAIPLLEEVKLATRAANPIANRQQPEPGGNAAHTADRGMAELELYYPFVGRGADRR